MTETNRSPFEPEQTKEEAVAEAERRLHLYWAVYIAAMILTVVPPLWVWAFGIGNDRILWASLLTGVAWSWMALLALVPANETLDKAKRSEL